MQNIAMYIKETITYTESFIRRSMPWSILCWPAGQESETMGRTAQGNLAYAKIHSQVPQYRQTPRTKYVRHIHTCRTNTTCPT